MEDGTGLLATDHPQVIGVLPTPTTDLPMGTAHPMTEGRLLVIGDLPVEAAAEVSAEEVVEVAKIVVGVERWIETETIHHAVIPILTDDAHRVQHSSCLQVPTDEGSWTHFFE